MIKKYLAISLIGFTASAASASFILFEKITGDVSNQRISLNNRTVSAYQFNNETGKKVTITVKTLNNSIQMSCYHLGIAEKINVLKNNEAQCVTREAVMLAAAADAKDEVTGEYSIVVAK